MHERDVVYFYGANTYWAESRDLRSCAKQCAWELLLAVRALVESYDASIVPD